MFSLTYNFPTTMSNSSKFGRKKYVQTKWIIPPSKLSRKKLVETPWIFRQKKLHRKKYVKTRWIFRPSKSHQKCTWKQRGFFDHRNYIEKVCGNDLEIFRNLVFDVSM